MSYFRTNGARTKMISAITLQTPANQNSRLKTSLRAQRRGYLSPLSRRLLNEAVSFSESIADDLADATCGISVGSRGRRYPT